MNEGKNRNFLWIIVIVVISLALIGAIIYFSDYRSDYKLVLNGEATVEITEGEIYNDLGCKVYKNGELLQISPEIIDNVNSQVPGEYTTKCVYRKESLTRKVIVKAAPPKEEETTPEEFEDTYIQE